MANVANTKSTGPTAKNMVSGGKKFPLKDREPLSHKMKSLGNTSGEAHSAIMGLRMKSEGFGGRPEKGTFTKNKAR